jgi:hypothetical protein
MTPDYWNLEIKTCQLSSCFRHMVLQPLFMKVSVEEFVVSRRRRCDKGKNY